MDPELEYALRVLGWASASHVIARANVSGRTGRYEETLTADLTDLMGTYGRAAAEYLKHTGASARIGVRVWDLPKTAESKVGADFVLVLRGAFQDARGWQVVRKLVLVQAKRQEWGKQSYATSKNHVEKARAMTLARGSLSDCFFVFYHDSHVLPHARAVSGWVGGTGVSRMPGAPVGPPPLWFATAKHGDGGFLAQHPAMKRQPAFIERSGYRPIASAHAGHPFPPASWAWGAGVLGASYFINPSLVTLKTSLPKPAHVVTSGLAFDEWLLALASCAAGTNVSTDRELETLLKAASASSATDDSADAFEPSTIVAVDLADVASRAQLRDILPEWNPEIANATRIVAFSEDDDVG